jgi:hypothetical protein
MGGLRFGCLMFIAGVVCTIIAIIIIMFVYFKGDIDLLPFI